MNKTLYLIVGLEHVRAEKNIRVNYKNASQVLDNLEKIIDDDNINSIEISPKKDLRKLETSELEEYQKYSKVILCGAYRGLCLNVFSHTLSRNGVQTSQLENHTL